MAITDKKKLFYEFVDRYLEDYTVTVYNKTAFHNAAMRAFESMDEPTYEGFIEKLHEQNAHS